MRVNKGSGDLSTENADPWRRIVEWLTVKRTNSLYFGVACNSAECIPLPTAPRLFRIATISIYSGVIDCRLSINPPILFFPIFFSPFFLSYLFVHLFESETFFDPCERESALLLYLLK